jgi:hypothetical protein
MKFESFHFLPPQTYVLIDSIVPKHTFGVKGFIYFFEQMFDAGKILCYNDKKHCEVLS